MTRARRLSAAVAATVALVMVPALTATAQPSGRISSISSTGDDVTLTFSGVDLPPETSIDPDSVAVTLDGEPVAVTVVPVTEAATPPRRTVMLALDTSGSMAEDGKIEAARDAATSFVDQLPDEVFAGVVAFANEPQVVVAPTRKRGPVRQAIAGLQPAGDTALYDAVLEAVAATGDEGVRSTIVLSDGGDTISESDLPSTVTGVREAGAQVDAIALGDGAEEAVSALTQITAATGGTVASANDADQLAAAFDVAAQAFTNELVITATVPEDFTAANANLEVTAAVGEETISATSFVSIGAGVEQARPAPPVNYGPVEVPPAPEGLPRWAGILGIVGVGVGFAALLWIAFGGTKTRPEDEVSGRLSIYSLTGGRPRKESEERTTTTALGTSTAVRNAVEYADRMVKKRDFEDNLALKLDAAGLPLRPAEWVLVHMAAAIGGGLLFLLIFSFNLIPALIGLALGVLLPFAFLSVKADRRRSKFLTQLPNTLQLMAGSMSAGYSLPQAVDTVVREGIDPISTEFNRALVESRLGVPVEDALDEVADRMQSRDFLWVVMAIRIQRQVGGNLAELLTTVAATLREREQLRRQVQVLSAEGRLSAWILGLLPVLFGLYLVITNPDYLSPLITDILGWIMLGVGAVLMLVGTLWMRKIVNVEV
jgi:tight adherence protein B